MQVVTASCGCFTDKRNKIQGKCVNHRGNKVVKGFDRVDVDG